MLDIFGVNPIDYRPFLLKNIKALQRVKKLIIYHSHLQEEEAYQQFSDFSSLSLQLWPEYPLETLVEKDEESMLDRLMVFLKE